MTIKALCWGGELRSLFPDFPPACCVYCCLPLLRTLCLIAELLGTPPVGRSWWMAPKPDFRGSYNACQLQLRFPPGFLSICSILQQAVNPSASPRPWASCRSRSSGIKETYLGTGRQLQSPVGPRLQVVTSTCQAGLEVGRSWLPNIKWFCGRGERGGLVVCL